MHRSGRARLLNNMGLKVNCRRAFLRESQRRRKRWRGRQRRPLTLEEKQLAILRATLEEAGEVIG